MDKRNKQEVVKILSYLKQIQRAVDYIEENLSNELSITEISQQVNFSMYHFHRIFQSFVGESLTEYIRRRRLTAAAHLLRNTNLRIIDIASEYGFNSQEAFTRAFKKMFGITPGMYRRQKQRLLLKEKPRLTISMLKHFEGGLLMEPRIVIKEGFTVVGMKCSTTLKNNKVPQLWDEFLSRIHEIKNRSDDKVAMGISEFCKNPHDEEFTYVACVPVMRIDEIPEGMVVKTVPRNKYVVVTHKGSLETLGNAYDFIYATWLPKSGYELAEADDFEVYDERFLGPEDEKSEIDIYVPIK
jgi:AraC family transcriptional regulator